MIYQRGIKRINLEKKVIDLNAQDLRNSILQLAVQGKLVEQRPDEGTAKELLKQIKAEKEQLIKEKKIKREKPLPEIAEDEIPFEIPESWEWVRLATVCVYLQRGKSPQYSDIEKIPVIAQKCNQWDSFQLEKAQFIAPETLEKYSEERLLQDKDILINSTGLGTVGRNQMYPASKNPYGIAVADSHVTVVRLDWRMLIPEFFFYYWRNPSVQLVIEDQTSGTTKQKELALTTIQKYVVPLPPLAEQKRIVAKIEEILPYIEQYDKAHTKLEIFNKKFPEDMKKSILQLAMQGKLVEQRPEEGTADELYRQIAAEKARLIKEGKIKAEKPLPEIEVEEIPFEIPKSWKWVRLNSIVTAITDGDHQPPPQVEIGVPFLVISNISQGMLSFINTRNVPQEYYDNLQDVRKPQNGDVLFSVTGSYGLVIPVKTDKAFCVQRHIAIIKKPFVSVDYLVKCLSAPHFYKQCTEKATGTAQKTVGLEVLRNLILPLPPLAEQKRIVAKIEEILPYCERLIK